MAAGNKTVKFQGTFGVVDASNVTSPNKIIKDLDQTVGQAVSFGPICIPGATVDYDVPFATITTAKRIYLSTDLAVTVKVDNLADAGFEWQGTGVLPSGATGISALYITTSATDTNIELVIAGD